jgi:hypothetical protein
MRLNFNCKLSCWCLFNVCILYRYIITVLSDNQLHNWSKCYIVQGRECCSTLLPDVRSLVLCHRWGQKEMLPKSVV